MFVTVELGFTWEHVATALKCALLLFFFFYYYYQSFVISLYLNIVNLTRTVTFAIDDEFVNTLLKFVHRKVLYWYILSLFRKFIMQCSIGKRNFLSRVFTFHNFSPFCRLQIFVCTVSLVSFPYVSVNQSCVKCSLDCETIVSNRWTYLRSKISQLLYIT